MYYKKFCLLLVLICISGCVKPIPKPIYSKHYDMGHVLNGYTVPKDLEGGKQMFIITEDNAVIKCDPSFYVYSKPRIFVRSTKVGDKTTWEVSRNRTEWYEVYNTPNTRRN